MKSGSWASYRAAMPPECFGEPDDEPRHHAPPNCDGCGRFVACRPGTGARLDYIPDSRFGPERAAWLCPACAARTPPPPTEAEIHEAERETDEAYARAMAEEADREAAAMAGRCKWCGNALPTAYACDACPACIASVTAEGPPYSSDDIPW